MTNKIYSLLGLATKAGKLVSGEDTCERGIKSERVDLIIVALDASQNTKKNFSDMCSYRNIKIKFFGKKELLGKCIGKDIRSVIGVSDSGFSKRLIELIDSAELENGGEQ